MRARFLDNKEDITKLRKCFAGLWSLDEANIVKRAIEKPELFVMKPQREGGGPMLSELFFALVVLEVSLTNKTTTQTQGTIYTVMT